MLLQHGVDPFVPREAPAFLQCFEIALLGQRPFLLRLQESLLPEVRHFPLLVLLIELDDVFERVHSRCRSQRGQIGVQVRFELVKQYLPFRLAELAQRGIIGRIDNNRAESSHFFKRNGEQLLCYRAGPKKPARDPNPRAAQAGWVEKRPVITVALVTASIGGGVAWIDTRQGTQQEGGVRYRPGHGTSGVLAVCDRDDSRTTDQTERRFDADDAAE